MAAPKGHPIWGNPLKPKEYTPEEFWLGALEYFEWSNKNPWIKKEQKKGNTNLKVEGDFKVNKKATEILSGLVNIPTERPYSLEALCNYLNISLQTFYNYANKDGYETYFEICARIRQIIDSQHFEGGMTGAFDAGIVARKLGLVDKKQTDLNIPNLNISVNSERTKENIQKLSE